MTINFIPKFNVKQTEPSTYNLGDNYMNQINYNEPPKFISNSYVSNNVINENSTEKYPFKIDYTSVYMTRKNADNNDSDVTNLIRRLISDNVFVNLIETKR